MKNSAQIAYEGLLTALSVVLLWLAAAVPAVGWGGCICAGILPAVMLSKRRVRAGTIIYTSTMVLSLILLPAKRYAIVYALFFGIYPLVKYAIERLDNLSLEWICKLIYAAITFAVLYFIAKLGLIILVDRLSNQPVFILAALFFIGFIFYDIIFSKMIALFSTLFKYVK